MAFRFLSLGVGALAFASSPVAGETEADQRKCFINDATNVQVCCSGELPTLLHPTILWRMLPEMCSKTNSHTAYIGGGSYVTDKLVPKSNFSSKSDRNDLVNTFRKANESGLAMAWTGPSRAWSGDTKGLYTFIRCRIRKTENNATIELSRSIGQNL